MANKPPLNADAAELAKFEAAAAGWWSNGKAFQALHDINPLRLAFIRKHLPPAGRNGVDVGCGGGILTEALAAAGAAMTGIDLGRGALAVADAHRRAAGLDIRYRRIDAESQAQATPGVFDFAVCMELLEHVPDPASLVKACARLVRPGGRIFFATLNRTPLAFLLAIVMAEGVLRIVPAGTHHYARFIAPRELALWAQQSNLRDGVFEGMLYLPFLRRATLIRSTAVNYLACFQKGAAGASSSLTRPP